MLVQVPPGRGAARLVLPVVDARGAETQLRGSYRGDVPARTAADHDDVKSFRRH